MASRVIKRIKSLVSSSLANRPKGSKPGIRAAQDYHGMRHAHVRSLDKKSAANRSLRTQQAHTVRALRKGSTSAAAPTSSGRKGKKAVVQLRRRIAQIHGRRYGKSTKDIKNLRTTQDYHSLSHVRKSGLDKKTPLHSAQRKAQADYLRKVRAVTTRK